MGKHPGGTTGVSTVRVMDLMLWKPDRAGRAWEMINLELNIGECGQIFEKEYGEEIQCAKIVEGSMIRWRNVENVITWEKRHVYSIADRSRIKELCSRWSRQKPSGSEQSSELRGFLPNNATTRSLF